MSKNSKAAAVAPLANGSRVQSERTSEAAPDVIALLLINLKLIREWYKSQPTRGVELGHMIMLELVLTDVAIALEFATQGKTWRPPA